MKTQSVLEPVHDLSNLSANWLMDRIEQSKQRHAEREKECELDDLEAVRETYRRGAILRTRFKIQYGYDPLATATGDHPKRETQPGTRDK